MNPLTELYYAILTALDVTVDHDDALVYANEPVYIQVDNKKLKVFLPTEKSLNSSNWTDKTAFHPAGESVFNSASEIQKMLAVFISLKTREVMSAALIMLINLIHDTKSHTKLTAKQKSIIGNFDTVTDKEITFIKNLYAKETGVTGQYPILKINLSVGGNIEETSYTRIASITRMIIEKNFFGIAGTKETKAIITDFYKYLLPDEFIAGSNSMTTPYLQSLLNLFVIVAEFYNDLKSAFEKYATWDNINIDWSPKVKDIGALKKKYLNRDFPGNTGKVIQKNNTVVKPAVGLTIPQKTYGLPELMDAPINSNPLYMNTDLPNNVLRPTITPTQQTNGGYSLADLMAAQQQSTVHVNKGPLSASELMSMNNVGGFMQAPQQQPFNQQSNQMFNQQSNQMLQTQQPSLFGGGNSMNTAGIFQSGNGINKANNSAPGQPKF